MRAGVFAKDSVYLCPTCHQGLRPLKTEPTLGFLCYSCPAIVTVYPGGACRIREVWSGREFDTTLAALRQPPPPEQKPAPPVERAERVRAV